MGVSYTERGRANQKRRTRAAVLEAAVELVRQGKSPSVAEAAEAAAVSRATAYRYFPTQESLLVEAATMAAGSVDESLAQMARLEDVDARVDAVVDALTAFMVEHDPGLRGMLRVSLERGRGDMPVRAGRRAAYLDEALAPLRSELTSEQLGRLNAALGMVIGTEALVVLRDVYEMEPDEARALMRWAAAALLDAGLREIRA